MASLIPVEAQEVGVSIPVLQTRLLKQGEKETPALPSNLSSSSQSLSLESPALQHK